MDLKLSNLRKEVENIIGIKLKSDKDSVEKMKTILYKNLTKMIDKYIEEEMEPIKFSNFNESFNHIKRVFGLEINTNMLSLNYEQRVSSLSFKFQNVSIFEISNEKVLLIKNDLIREFGQEELISNIQGTKTRAKDKFTDLMKDKVMNVMTLLMLRDSFSGHSASAKFGKAIFPNKYNYMESWADRFWYGSNKTIDKYIENGILEKITRKQFKKYFEENVGRTEEDLLKRVEYLNSNDLTISQRKRFVAETLKMVSEPGYDLFNRLFENDQAETLF